MTDITEIRAGFSVGNRFFDTREEAYRYCHENQYTEKLEGMLVRGLRGHTGEKYYPKQVAELLYQRRHEICAALQDMIRSEAVREDGGIWRGPSS